MSNIKWTKSSYGYRGSAKHWSECELKHLTKYGIAKTSKGWELIGFFGNDNFLTVIETSTLKEAKELAQIDWDKIPAIETDEDSGMRNATYSKK